MTRDFQKCTKTQAHSHHPVLRSATKPPPSSGSLLAQPSRAAPGAPRTLSRLGEGRRARPRARAHATTSRARLHGPSSRPAACTPHERTPDGRTRVCSVPTDVIDKEQMVPRFSLWRLGLGRECRDALHVHRHPPARWLLIKLYRTVRLYLFLHIRANTGREGPFVLTFSAVIRATPHGSSRCALVRALCSRAVCRIEAL